jgi:hypothetical protein
LNCESRRYFVRGRPAGQLSRWVRTLRDRDNSFERSKHPRFIAHCSLRNEDLRFFHEEMQRRPMRFLQMEELLGEFGCELLAITLAEHAHFQHRWNSSFNQEICEKRSGARLERKISVQPAEYWNVVALGFAVGPDP